ncbi:MAG: hypothetical protein FH756_18610 [Firmicutes bacterium]|nr:hypothetical protein [Bacillota bacterium]
MFLQIKEFFEEKEDSIGKIIKAPFESIYAVKSSDGIYLIETGGFKPKLISDEDNPELKEWVKNNVN